MARYLGIDPGLNGGLALLSPDGLLVEVMPTVKDAKGKRTVDGAELARLIRGWRPTCAIVEKVGARPKQGVCSMFSFGHGLGVVHGVLLALGIPLNQIEPRTWQKTMFAMGGSASMGPKEKALEVAHGYFPHVCFRATARSKKSHDGMIDAALLAQYGRIRWTTP